MGRLYERELEELDETYSWSLGVDVLPLAGAAADVSNLPLLAVGSGGALTAAVILALLHRHCAKQMASVTTPFLLDSALPRLSRAGVWLLSAGGRNKDIRRALSTAASREPQSISVLCGAPGSLLMREAERYPWVNSNAVTLPSRDGFLAVNSSLAFAGLLARAYGGGVALPSSLVGLLGTSFAGHAALAADCAELWSKKTLIVIHGATTQAAALDLESRFTEAALGVVQVADYRNFGHGRHHWIAKHGESTAVLALAGPGDQQLSRNTLRALPKRIASRELVFSGSLQEVVISSLVASIRLAGLAGRSRGIDPGRPGVPSFGSKLYGLPAPRVADSGAAAIRHAAIARKCDAGRLGSQAGRLWEEALAAFETRLTGATFGALVLDYDGTVRCGRDRSAQPSGSAVKLLSKLSLEGLAIGIATGRGSSVLEPLRRIFPKKRWQGILVGYHNGAAISSLAEAPPSSLTPMPPKLAAAKQALEKTICRQYSFSLRSHPRQLTMIVPTSFSEDELWALVAGVLARAGLGGLTVLRSSHSVDVLAEGVSKLRVVEAASELGGGDVLCIGDRGRWPGNDHELLGTRYGLSVDEVSRDLDTGWNLAPPGMRGAGALAYYLAKLRKVRGARRWRMQAT